MKVVLPVLTSLAMTLSAHAQANPTAAPLPRATTPDDVRAVSPALHAYATQRLAGDVWKRPGLAARDRSLVTVATLVARQQTAEMAQQFERSFTSGPLTVFPRPVKNFPLISDSDTGWQFRLQLIGGAAIGLPPLVTAVLRVTGERSVNKNHKSICEVRLGGQAGGSHVDRVHVISPSRRGSRLRNSVHSQPRRIDPS